MVLGASFAHSSEDNAAWSSALTVSSGQLVRVVLHNGAGARFANVVLALSTVGNVALTFYSFGLSFMSLPSLPFLSASKAASGNQDRARSHSARVGPMLIKSLKNFFKRLQLQLPRFIYPLLATAIVLPLSIVGAQKFSQTLTNFLSIIGYWAAPFCATLLMEHWMFKMPSARRRATELARTAPEAPKSTPTHGAAANVELEAASEATEATSEEAARPQSQVPYEERAEQSALAIAYPRLIYNEPHALPTGVAALFASVLSVGIMVPCMDQIWFSGPFAERSGDLAFEVGFAFCLLLYPPLRLLDRYCFGR